MLLLEEMLQHIAHNSLLHRPELGDTMQAASVTERPYTYACTFYGTRAAFTVPEASAEFISPFASRARQMSREQQVCDVSGCVFISEEASQHENERSGGAQAGLCRR